MADATTAYHANRTTRTRGLRRMSALCQKRTHAPQQFMPRLGQVLSDFR